MLHDMCEMGKGGDSPIPQIFRLNQVNVPCVLKLMFEAREKEK